MSKNKNKKKAPIHITYNKKVFIAPDSITSMSAIHTKIYSDGTAIVRLSDCHNSIKWHNDLNSQKEVVEMLTKLDNAINTLSEFREQVGLKFNGLI